MWKYIKPYLPYALLAAAFMVGEVLMDLLQPRLMSRIVDEGVLGSGNGGTGDLQLIFTLGLTMVGLVLFGGFCGSMNNVFTHMAGQNIGNEIRKDCFRRIMTFSFPQMDSYGAGSLITRVTGDITQVQNFVSQFVRGMIRTSMLTLSSVYFLLRINRTFGLIVLCALPFMLACMTVCMVRANPLLTRLQARLDQINAIMQEDVTGIRTIKACVRQTYEKLRFGEANEGLVKTQLRVLVIFAFMNPVVNALMYLAVGAILLAGSYQVGAGQTSPGVIMAAITYTTQLLNGILMLVMLFQNISKGMASWRRVKEVLDSRPEMEDGRFDGAADDDAAPRGKVQFRDVSFAFPGSGQTILKHINLTIEPGETVAIMGATGCGKTALAGLIPRFYDVTDGAVLVDGVDVRRYSRQALRAKVVTAMQKSELFSLSVRDNIVWDSKGGGSDPEQRVREAAAMAQAEAFIGEMPQGFDTPVAEQGASLSGGQKQRISIARALFRPADVFIFDDATSALDLKTEAMLYEELRRRRPNTTKIIIAQRIASVRQANRIVVLADGGIEGCGTHEELLRTCKTYQDIYDSQIGKEGEKIG